MNAQAENHRRRCQDRKEALRLRCTFCLDARRCGAVGLIVHDSNSRPSFCSIQAQCNPPQLARDATHLQTFQHGPRIHHHPSAAAGSPTLRARSSSPKTSIFSPRIRCLRWRWSRRAGGADSGHFLAATETQEEGGKWGVRYDWILRLQGVFGLCEEEGGWERVGCVCCVQACVYEVMKLDDGSQLDEAVEWARFRCSKPRLGHTSGRLKSVMFPVLLPQHNRRQDSRFATSHLNPSLRTFHLLKQRR